MQQQASDTAGKLPRTQGGDSTLVEWEAMEGIPWYEFVRQTQLARGVSTAPAEDPTGVYKTRTDSARGSHLDSGYSAFPEYQRENAGAGGVAVSDVMLCNIAAAYGTS